MKDKEARVDIAGLEARIDFLSRRTDKQDSQILHLSTRPAPSEPDVLLRPSRSMCYPRDLVRIPLSDAFQMLLNQLNLELTEERMVLKEIVDDDETTA